MSKREIIDARALNIALNRLCCKLIENHGDFSNSILIGMQPRGVQVLERIVKLLESTYGVEGVRTGVLVKLSLENQEVLYEGTLNACYCHFFEFTFPSKQCTKSRHFLNALA